MIKHLAALAALVAFLSLPPEARAGGDRDASAAKESQASPPPILWSAKLSQDVAQIQADFKQLQNDCDSGAYDQAQNDLNLLIEHRRQYYADSAQAAKNSTTSNSTVAATSSTPPAGR